MLPVAFAGSFVKIARPQKKLSIVTELESGSDRELGDFLAEAARRIDVPPRFCRGYEDTDLGMQAIRSAGMEAVDVRELLKARL